jgi:hypothetical protein
VARSSKNVAYLGTDYMHVKSIDHEWLSFVSLVFGRGPKPSDVQLSEMKKAFFAGAWSMFCAFERVGEPDISEEESERFLLDRKQECIAFKNEMMREYAEGN